MGGTVKMERFDLEAREQEQAEAAAEAEKAPESASGTRQKAPPDPAALQTRLARKFTTIADLVNDGFTEFRIGAGSWGVELTAPEGMSTSGGKQRLQHLRLRPRRPGFANIVGGSVDAESKLAELRDYDYVRVVHELRFKKPVEVTEQEWEQFLRKAELELRAQDIQSVRVGPPKDVVAEYAATRTPISRPMIAAFAAIVLLASFVIWRVILAIAH